MKLLELLGQLIDLHKKHGNIQVILQADEEGNYYESPRGAEFTYYDGDESTFDNAEEAEENGARPVIVVYP
ncbi:hypothetical protein REC_41 [Pseudomonas phage REC]|nr:hypothetical protein REC_41 [Pseudomonas phage REC]UGL62637.1 hypothetical protein [Pseudomonas phage REC1]